MVEEAMVACSDQRPGHAPANHVMTLTVINQSDHDTDDNNQSETRHKFFDQVNSN